MFGKIKYRLRHLKKILGFNARMLKRGYQESKKAVLEYPHTIQLPITHLCNFDCVMCGMHQMCQRKDFTSEELGEILSDKLFSKVQAVGVNGGEPFIKPDILDCFQVMIDKLPELKVFNIISNGYFTDKILNTLVEVKKLCKDKGICVNLSISVDGVGDMQDFHRGRKNAYVNADATVTKILENKDKYVDSLNIICTITKYNIERITEVEAWAEVRGVEVSYNIATVNVRIENEDREDDFTIFSDEHARMLAQEFFYCKYQQTGSEKYFALYLYLKDRKRYADCPCKYNEWITLTPDTQIGFCATHSKNLGSALEKSAHEIVKENMDYLEELKGQYCEGCSHYMYSLNKEGMKLLKREQLKNWFIR